MPVYRLYTARWPLADLEPARRPPTTAADRGRQASAAPGTPAVTWPSDLNWGVWEIPRVLMHCNRTVLAGAVVHERMRSTFATRGRACDVARHQQAAMSEKPLAPEPADLEHEPGQPEVISGVERATGM